jgi:hypothetical protein
MNAHAHTSLFDAELVLNHVKMIHGLAAGIDGILVVSAYGEDPRNGRKEKFTVERFAIGDVKGMSDAIMRYDMRPHANVYVGLQVMRRDLEPGKRGGLKDIVANLGLVADMDADTGKNKGEMPVEPSLVLETSPGNKQVFYSISRCGRKTRTRLPGSSRRRQAAIMVRGTLPTFGAWLGL